MKKDIVADATVGDEEEHKWLTEQEQVKSNIFEGKQLKRGSKPQSEDIAAQYANVDRSERRRGMNTTVMVGGYAISKESLGCKDWEAVPTFAGKNPSLANSKRAKRAAINSQGHCQVCLDGGNIVCCQGCPRSYHMKCLDTEFQSKALGSMFFCPQHECVDCRQKTNDTGGMLYRCRWCERAYCEDHLEFDETELIGDGLPEFELLDFPENATAFYVECSACRSHFKEKPDDKKLCDEMAESIRIEHEHRFNIPSTPSTPMTDATTLESTGVSTPAYVENENGYRSDLKRQIKESMNGSTNGYSSAPSTIGRSSTTKTSNWPNQQNQKLGNASNHKNVAANGNQYIPFSKSQPPSMYNSAPHVLTHAHPEPEYRFHSNGNGPAQFQPMNGSSPYNLNSAQTPSPFQPTIPVARNAMSVSGSSYTNYLSNGGSHAHTNGYSSSTKNPSPPSMNSAQKPIVIELLDSDGDDVVEVTSTKKRKIAPELSDDSNKRQQSAYYGHLLN